MYPDWITIVTNLGFPIAVAIFVLVRLNGKLDKLARTIERNTRAVIFLCQRNGGNLSEEERRLLD